MEYRRGRYGIQMRSVVKRRVWSIAGGDVEHAAEREGAMVYVAQLRERGDGCCRH